MHDSQPEVVLKGVEVAVAVEERVAFVDAEGCYQAIDLPPNGVPGLTKGPVILGSLDRKLLAAGIEYIELRESILHLQENLVIANSLQHFHKDQVC